MTGFKKSLNKYFRLACLLTSAVLAATAFFACEKVPDHCDRHVRYNPDFEFCYAGKAYSLCAGEMYHPLTQGCASASDPVGTRCLDNTFVPTGTPCGGYTLTTATAPADGGSIQRSSEGPNYAAGSQVVLVATAEDGYAFAGWAGAETSEKEALTVTMDRNKPLVAMFKPTTVTLATTAFPPDGGTINRVEDGDEVTVTAEATPDHTFTNWAGASTSTENTVTVTVDEGKTLVAIFTPDVYTLTVNASPETGGTVFVNNTAAEGATKHDAGASVNVVARAAEGHVFTGWSGASVSTSPSITIAINGSQTLTANFRPGTSTPCDGLTSAAPGSPCCLHNPAFNGCRSVTPDTTYTLTVKVNPEGCAETITLFGSGVYNAGDTAHVHVTAAEGCTFIGWSGAGITADTGSVSAYVVMDSSKTVTANFRRDGNGGDCGAGHGHFNDGVSYGCFTDVRDNQSYRTVKIGEQVWMAENLNFQTSSGSWCYNDTTIYCDIYGRLYDWYTVMCGGSGSSCTTEAHVVYQGICPPGWHVPSDAEWTDLVNFADGESSVASAKLRTKSGWYTSGDDYVPGTDDFGFSALPGGYRSADGYFNNVGRWGDWWSAMDDSASHAKGRGMYWDASHVYQNWYGKDGGLSLRCIQSSYTPPPGHTLRVVVDPPECGADFSVDSSFYSAGLYVPISVNAAEDCTFTGWSGAGIVDTSAMSTTVFMDSSKTVTAHFTRDGGGRDSSLFTGPEEAWWTCEYYVWGMEWCGGYVFLPNGKAVFLFEYDGELVCKGELDGTWHTAGDTITFCEYNESDVECYTNRYSISGNTLTMVDDEYGDSYTFTKQTVSTTDPPLCSSYDFPPASGGGGMSKKRGGLAPVFRVR